MRGDESDDSAWLAGKVGDKAPPRGVEEVLAEEGAVVDVGQEVGLLSQIEAEFQESRIKAQ